MRGIRISHNICERRALEWTGKCSSERFKLLTDPYCVEKVRDVVGLYMSPPDNAIVLSIDEKSQVQALDRTQPLSPMTPGPAETRTHDSVRNGTTSLFAALNTATGQVIGKCFRRHRSREFLKFLKEIDDRVFREPGLSSYVMDDHGTHKTAALRRWFERQPEYHLHFTPTSGTWLNQVELFLPGSPRNESGVECFGVCRCWRERSWTTWPITTTIRGSSSGPPRRI